LRLQSCHRNLECRGYGKRHGRGINWEFHLILPLPRSAHLDCASACLRAAFAPPGLEASPKAPARRSSARPRGDSCRRHRQLHQFGRRNKRRRRRLGRRFRGLRLNPFGHLFHSGQCDLNGRATQRYSYAYRGLEIAGGGTRFGGEQSMRRRILYLRGLPRCIRGKSRLSCLA